MRDHDQDGRPDSRRSRRNRFAPGLSSAIEADIVEIGGRQNSPTEHGTFRLRVLPRKDDALEVRESDEQGKFRKAWYRVILTVLSADRPIVYVTRAGLRAQVVEQLHAENGLDRF
jgi:hypothetical protein